jgi:hypothetical protein
MLSGGKGRFSRLDEDVARHSEAQTGCPVTYTYTEKTLQRLLAGLEVTRSFRAHIFPWQIEEYTRYNYKKTWYFRIMPKNIFRRLEKIAGWHLCAEARLSAL